MLLLTKPNEVEGKALVHQYNPKKRDLGSRFIKYLSHPHVIVEDSKSTVRKTELLRPAVVRP